MIANDRGRMPPPLSSGVLALLAHERVPLLQPEIVRARLVARAREALRTSPALPLSTRKSNFGGRRLLFAAAAAITLLAGAAAAYQMIARPTPSMPLKLGTATAPKQAPLDPAVEAEAAPAAVKQADATATAPAPAAAVAAIPLPGRRAVPAAKREGGLEELQLLSRARQADAHGDATEVLAVVAEHERTYPAGRLAEEREVLRVKALVGLGRGSDARRAAAKFRTQFPRSVLLPTIEDMLASLR